MADQDRMSQATSYETKSVKVTRARELGAIARAKGAGWELVSNTPGATLVTLEFRRQRVPLRKGPLIGAIAAAVIVIGAVVIWAAIDHDGRAPGTRPDAAPGPVLDVSPAQLTSRLDRGDLELGQRFRLTGTMTASELWTVGPTGHYVVYLQTPQPAHDLVLFAEQKQTALWRDGTRVKMVVEVVEATLDGRTSADWLRITSARVFRP